VSEGTVDARHRHLAQQARRFRARKRVYAAICDAVLALACAGALGPYFYLLSTSLKKTSYLYSYPPQWFSWPPYSLSSVRHSSFHLALALHILDRTASEAVCETRAWGGGNAPVRQLLPKINFPLLLGASLLAALLAFADI
jgi:ABC-type glycerol-3-phosphate transport system permease component